ncbi:alpha/beta hydrolase [Streptacidiphilus jiangxiensis]|uniref:Alpha/beta hydrolase fold n=1 Tax=Streptacidiphilus jiangxiensis TaxID=235985 RepID=A0A1H7IC84_STRJI|nr:alpha/beta fold hydrolase [Streptacidiphilus jiangxiensis]SEK60106.1 alpha/beta hydrolase fold [Streptacidiphilus jiangxiensis]
MRVSVERQGVRFTSAGAECAAWYYPGRNGACVVMAGGFAVPKEPGTDRFARRFQEAGFDVLAFDFRGLGESAHGQSADGPCPVLTPRGQLADWRAAFAFARTLPGVDPARVGLWSFSAPGGQLFQVAAVEPEVAAVVAQSPTVDGLVASRNAAAFQRPTAMVRLVGRGIVDQVGSWFGRAPLAVPLGGRPGEVAVVTTPDGGVDPSPLDPDGVYPQWRRQVAARSVLPLGGYRPGRQASRVRCPLLVVVCDGDQSAPPGSALKAAARAPRAEVVHLPGGHYAPFQDAHEKAVAAELEFLGRHLAV